MRSSLLCTATALLAVASAAVALADTDDHSMAGSRRALSHRSNGDVAARKAAHRQHHRSKKVTSGKTQRVNKTNPAWISKIPVKQPAAGSVGKNQVVNDTDLPWISKIPTDATGSAVAQQDAPIDLPPIRIGTVETQGVDAAAAAADAVAKTQQQLQQQQLVRRAPRVHTGHQFGLYAANRALFDGPDDEAELQQLEARATADDGSEDCEEEGDSSAVSDSTDLINKSVNGTSSGDAWGKASIGVTKFSPAKNWPVQGIYNAAKKAIASGKGVMKTYSTGSGSRSAVLNTWANKGKGVYMWMADMDVDCDGEDYRCRGNMDGQARTTFGALAAYEVPFIVMPDDFYMAHQSVIPANAMAAVICNGKLFYGILGDTNGNTPRVTGEASWLMARTCFPDDDLNGSKGHAKPDVLYLQFLGADAKMTGVGSRIKSMAGLQSKGDTLMGRLVESLNL